MLFRAELEECSLLAPLLLYFRDVWYKPCSVSCHINETGQYAFPFPLKLVKMLYFEAGDEIVDLTCESLEPVVVDLTHNDSVVVSGGA